MLLRNPFYIDNLGADQPYNSMLLIAPYCYNNCPDCHNKHLKDGELRDFTPEELAEEFLSNPFWEGVTVGGLEPHHAPKEWWKEFNEFIKLIGGCKVTIYTSSQTDTMPVPAAKSLYYKLGDYRPDRPSKEVKIGDWSITIASDNQEFIKVR